MEWNWQRADWPDFSWQRSRLARAEEQFLLKGGVFLGSVRHLDVADRDQLAVDALSVEAVTTSQIEGEILDRPREHRVMSETRVIGSTPPALLLG
jgi:Fic family protein